MNNFLKGLLETGIKAKGKEIERAVGEMGEDPVGYFSEKVGKLAQVASDTGKKVADRIAKEAGRTDFEEILQELGLKAPNTVIYEQSQIPKTDRHRRYKMLILDIDPSKITDSSYVHRKIDSCIRSSCEEGRCDFVVYRFLSRNEMQIELYEKHLPSEAGLFNEYFGGDER